MTTMYTPLLSGEAVAVSASVMAVAAMVMSNMRRRAVHLRPAARRDPLQWRSGSGPLLSGMYRGRFVEMTLAENGMLCVRAHIRNRAGLFAEFADGDGTGAEWLPPRCLRSLYTLPDRWSIAVRGKQLFFTCFLMDNDPEWMRQALELSCDIAEAAESVGVAG